MPTVSSRFAPHIGRLAAGLLVLAGCFAMPGHASELRRTAIVKAVEMAKPSVVNIHGQKTVSGTVEAGFGEGARRVNGMGTGVVIDERGYIITNFHVVDGVRRIEVTLASGDTKVARLISHDATTDLAIIKIDSASPLPVLPVGTSSDLMTGEPVIAVGNAYGYENTVTRGIVSALHRSVQVSDTQNYEDLIQTDASINPGNSGGPLLNIDGEMIGINVAVRAGAQGIGFAIPVDKAMEVAAQLMSTTRVDRTWHGITSTKADPTTGGLIVGSIDATGPAAQSGLKVGDILTTVNNQSLRRPLDLERALIGHKVGEAIEVKASRGEEAVNFEFALASAPRGAALTGDATWDVLGLRLTSINSDEFRKFGSRYRGGLSVTSVRPDSPAAKQGIRRGDVLVGMHIWETISLDNVSYILNRPDIATLDPLKFYILRGDETLFGHLKVSLQR